MRASVASLRTELIALLVAALLTCGIASPSALADEGSGDADLLANVLANSGAIVSADVALGTEEGDGPEPVVGSFVTDGMLFAVVGEGEAQFVAVATEPDGESLPVPAHAQLVEEVALGDGTQEPVALERTGDGEPEAFAIPPSVSHEGVEYAVVAIGPNAFYGTSYDRVAVPASVVRIDHAAFRSPCVSWVEVDPENSEYASFDGALYSADLATLRLIPEGRVGAVRIASSVTEVDPEVFSHCPSVDSLVADADSAAYKLLQGSGETCAIPIRATHDRFDLTENKEFSHVCENAQVLESSFDQSDSSGQSLSERSLMHEADFSQTWWGRLEGGGGWVHFAGSEVGLYDYYFTSNTGGIYGGKGKGNAYQVHYHNPLGTLHIAVAERRGWTLTGWACDDGRIVDDSTEYAGINNGDVWTARWKLNTYTITYNLGGGTNSSSNPSSYTIKSDTITLKDPTWSGHTFGGWYSDAGYKTKVTSIPKESTGNKVLYAKWDLSTYTLTVKPNGGSIGGFAGDATFKMTYDTGNNNYIGNTFSWPGRTFDGLWTAPKGGTQVYDKNGVCIVDGTYWSSYNWWHYPGDLTVYAHWIPITYTLTVKPNGGTFNGGPEWKLTSSGDYQRSYTCETEDFDLPKAIPSSAMYEFAGWFGAGAESATTTIRKGTTGDLRYTASWRYAYRSASFEGKGGVVYETRDAENKPVPVSEITFIDGTTAIFTASNAYAIHYHFNEAGKLHQLNAERKGYAHVGWDGTTRVDKSSTANGFLVDKGVYWPLWDAIDYKVVCDLDGGTVEGSSTYEHGYTIESDDFTLPVPVKPGNTFVGWTGANGTTPQMGVRIPKGSTGNKSYKANWQANAYTIALDPNGEGATVDPASVNATYDEDVTLPLPTRAGYIFSGWNTERDGSGRSYGSGSHAKPNLTDAADGTVTLYAEWVPATSVTVPLSVTLAVDPSNDGADVVVADWDGRDEEGAFLGIQSANGMPFAVRSVSCEPVNSFGEGALVTDAGSDALAPGSLFLTMGGGGEGSSSLRFDLGQARSVLSDGDGFDAAGDGLSATSEDARVPLSFGLECGPGKGMADLAFASGLVADDPSSRGELARIVYTIEVMP